MNFERQRKTKAPCAGCGLHTLRCICAFIPKLKLRTRVTLVVHAKELKRTTNTGRLAMRALENSAMVVRGASQTPLDLSSCLSEEYQTLLLYPCTEAIDLQTVSFAKPVHLIVPDGNWRQAAKVNTRHKELAAIPRVCLGPLSESLPYHLRKEHFAEGLSTLQAIAEALKILEGEAVGRSLKALYLRKLKATLDGRGVHVEGAKALWQFSENEDSKPSMSCST